MNRIEKQLVRTETYYVFTAFDGTEFKDEEQCRKYEESAECVARSRFTLVKANPKANLTDLFNDYDCDFYFFTPKTEEEIQNFLMWLKLTGNPISENYESPAETRCYPAASEIKIGMTYLLKDFCKGECINVFVPENYVNYVKRTFAKALEPEEEKTE